MTNPVRTVLMDDPYHDPSEDVMQFHLTYEGKLLSNGNVNHTHEIRKHFHPQLKRLWSITPVLSGMVSESKGMIDPNQNGYRRRIEVLAERFARFNCYNFVPLVASDLNVSFCGLEILYLRRDPPGSVVTNYGDIDNRLNTLFDAFQMPHGKNQLGGYDAPGEDEKPFYVLLEDDRLITKISVETDILLEPVNRTFDANDSRLVITVTIQPSLIPLDFKANDAGLLVTED